MGVRRSRTKPQEPTHSEGPQKKRGIKISEAVLVRSRSVKKRDKSPVPVINLFAPAKHPDGVVPDGMAMDEGYSGWANNQIASAYADGVAFLGYPYLAALSQRAEYRVIVETIALEMTRKFVKFQATGDAEAKAEKIKRLEEAFRNLKVKEAFRSASEIDGFFGRAHIYPVIGEENADKRDWTEDGTDIGTGWDEVSKAKIGIGSLKALRVVEPVWTYPTDYDSSNPLSAKWYNPQNWYVMGRRIHTSRLLTIVGRPMPDLLKPAYSFGGLALTQMAKPYVENWVRTRQSVSDLVYKFSTMVLKTDLGADMGAEGGTDPIARAELFNNIGGNLGVWILDKEREDLANVSAPLAGLHELQAQSLEQVSVVSQIPLVKWTGIGPSGLNASSEGELEVFEALVHARQERDYSAPLHKLNGMVQLSLFGELDPEITIAFLPLAEETESEKATRRKMDADTDAVLVDLGSISPEESRARVADDPNSPYAGIDKNVMPDPAGGEEGLEPNPDGSASNEQWAAALGERGEEHVPEGSGEAAEPHQWAKAFGATEGEKDPMAPGEFGGKAKPEHWAKALGGAGHKDGMKAEPDHWEKALGLDDDD